jgi:hypothetical protein
MSTDLRATQSLAPPLIPGAPALPLEPVGFATCPLCHTADATMTSVAVAAGADWHCTRCGQRWDAVRLAAVAACAVWQSERVV